MDTNRGQETLASSSSQEPIYWLTEEGGDSTIATPTSDLNHLNASQGDLFLRMPVFANEEDQLSHSLGFISQGNFIDKDTSITDLDWLNLTLDHTT